MAERQLSESFVHALLECQDRLHAYIVALVMNQDEANDILQNTNVVVCQQADRLPEIKNFTAWACRIAYFEVLSSRKRQKRDKLLFDADLLDLIAEEIPRHLEKVDLYQNLLDRCLAELSDAQRELILRRYGRGGSIPELAQELGRPIGSVQQTLYRIRTTLMRCVQRKMRDEL
jgi:RNA polymerase sigma-70 factor (ECF subfamily)